MAGEEQQGPSSQKLLPLLLLLLNVVAAVSGDSPVPVSGFLGEQVVLPCTYKGNVPVSDLLVIWGTLKYEFLHKFVNGSDDLREQDPRFRSRTNLFKDQLEQGNWSVLITDLRETDQEEYDCQIYSKMGDQLHWEKVVQVNLSVTERAPTPGPNTPVLGPGLATGARVGLGIGIVAGIVAIVVVGGIMGYIILERQRWNCDQKQCTTNQKSRIHPLTGVTILGEARSLVPTAPEHQDGAAGEQNLLGNGAVQH
ncbi:uncharacterized protein LOC122544200 [Chiloscyllium plagiosum]|uniref:uncharacterized protein LOC122544200 n=1 Tax=Chiloscyllium plagiosum TaxID=36176 RepID=UPI001CB821D4|nr:uncharacterized protein LOC122544200 [Chiloscyllium plagiosum]